MPLPSSQASISRGSTSRRSSGRSASREREREHRPEVTLEQQVEERAGDDAGEQRCRPRRAGPGVDHAEQHGGADHDTSAVSVSSSGSQNSERALALGRTACRSRTHDTARRSTTR